MSRKRMVYKYCPVAGRTVPIEEARRNEWENRKDASVAHGYIQDEMPETVHPVTGEVFTSKSKFRARTRELGYEEVGTAYENGYDPSYIREDRWKETERKLSETFREIVNNGYSRE